uniref:Uncharacterized protein n=1 Tax=Anopheles atroparvus TaxID=41427 RepID=A0A182JIY4_ANOAO
MAPSSPATHLPIPIVSPLAFAIIIISITVTRAIRRGSSSAQDQRHCRSDLMCTICWGVRDRLPARRSIAEEPCSDGEPVVLPVVVMVVVVVLLGVWASVPRSVGLARGSGTGSGPKFSGSVRPGNFWCSISGSGLESSSERSLDSEPQADLWS